MNVKYRNALTEVTTILKYYLKDEELKKIPPEKLEWLEKNVNKNYMFVIDENKPLEEQNISQEANSIIVTLYRDYFIEEERKKVLDEILEINEYKEKKNRLLRNQAERIANMNNNFSQIEEEKNDVGYELKREEKKMEIIPKGKEKIFNKILSFIKKIFRVK